MQANIIASVLALIVGSASPDTPSPSAIEPAVVVTAPPPIKDIPDLVRAFGRHPDGIDHLARWQVTLCPAIIGPPPDQTAYILNRLRTAAKTVGVPIGGRYCTPDLIVVLTPDFNTMTALIARRGYKILGSDHAQFVGERIRFTQHDNRPYHKFVMTTEVLAGHGSSDQKPQRVDDLSNLSASLEGAGLNFSGINGYPEIDHAPDSYVTPDIDYSFSRVILVIDQKRLAGLSLQQVSAYVLMLSLADVNDHTENGLTTILQIADPSVPTKEKPQDLTFWDRTYLGALYRASSQKSIGLQEGEMDTEIMRAAKNQTALPRHIGLDGPASGTQ